MQLFWHDLGLSIERVFPISINFYVMKNILTHIGIASSEQAVTSLQYC